MLLNNWKQTFGLFRNPGAIFTHLRTLQKLPKKDKNLVIKVLSDYVTSVLNGSFPDVRYQIEGNQHLQKVFTNQEIRKQWLQSDSPQQIATKKYTIMESHDPEDLLLIGTEIQGSCLNVNHPPEQSKCLVSYLMDGENRFIIVKDINGKIVARSLLRLMWDSQNKQPVILQEKHYSNVKDLKITNAINRWALKKAQRMGLPLVSVSVGKGKRYPGTVVHFGGKAPYTYSDAGRDPIEGGGVKSGKFKIKNSYVIWSP